VKVRPFSGDIEHLLKLQSVIIRQGDKERQLAIEESDASPPLVLMRFAGIDSPEAAKALGGAQLLVSREQASPLRAGEFYVEDLKGLAVTAPGGEMVGRVTDIVEGGGGELAEIMLNNGELRLVPFRKEFFSEIDPEKGVAALQNVWILE